MSAACAVPDTITFALRLACNEVSGATDATQLLLVTNWSVSGYRPDLLRALMSQREGRERFAGQAATLASRGGYGGVLLDLRALGARDVNELVALAAVVGDSIRARELTSLGIVVPVADTAAYPGRHLGALADFLALRLELDPATPGPATPADRMPALIGARAAERGAHRLMLLVPADGYLWRDGAPRARVSFEQAVATARAWNEELVRDESSATLRARAPGRGELWINDAELVARIARDARRLGIRRFALYGFGGEDPRLWKLLSALEATR